jgi:hypothetical protein
MPRGHCGFAEVTGHIVLLTELFEYRAIEIGLDLSALKKRRIDPIFASASSLPDDRRQLLDEDFRNIVSLA